MIWNRRVPSPDARSSFTLHAVCGPNTLNHFAEADSDLCGSISKDKSILFNLITFAYSIRITLNLNYYSYQLDMRKSVPMFYLVYYFSRLLEELLHPANCALLSELNINNENTIVTLP